MARYGKEHKQATRQRMIETAGARFKQDGIDGSGIATLMTDAGLTNGAFYAHFRSKDDLVAQVLVAELAAQAARYRTLAPGREGLADLIRGYLSPEHRDDRRNGCPSAALLDEVGRCSESVRDGYTSGAREIVDEIAARLEPENPASATGRAIALFTSLVGTMQLARALSDDEFSDAVLAQGVESALALID